MQRREWKDDRCAWCNTVDELVLDHIIPVAAGGSNDRTNSQTLCQTCNLWKMWFVDRPLTIAMKATTGANQNPVYLVYEPVSL
jgi:5-methylcytosine-specific restriction endonuclease McrA